MSGNFLQRNVIDRQTDRYRQTNMHAYIKTYGRTDIHTEIQIRIYREARTAIKGDGWKEGGMEKRWMVEWRKEKKED